MFCLRSLFLLIVLFASFSKVVNCKLFVHTAGNPHFFDHGQYFHDGWLFNKSSQNPTNYTLSYKYSADSFSGLITYIELSVNGTENSTAAIDYSKAIDSTENRHITITANVQNATNLTTRVRVKGFGGLNSNGFDSLASILHRTSFRPRWVTALCAEDSSNQIQRHKRVVEYGRRHSNDAIVRFQREIVTADSPNYPNFTFSFSDKNVTITYVALTMNTPGAMVFSNRVLFNETVFRATVYELNKETFSTDLVIYGQRF